MSSDHSVDLRRTGRRIAITGCGLLLSLAVGVLPFRVPRDLALALLMSAVLLLFLPLRPLWLLGLLVLYVPFHGLFRPVITSEPVAVSEAIRGISLTGGVKDFLIVALFVYAVVCIVRERRQIALTAVDGLLILFLAWTGLEVARAIFMGRSLIAAVLDVRMDVEYLLLYWVVAALVRDARQLSRLVQVTIYGAGLAALVGVVFALCGQRMLEGVRAFGPFAATQTNVYGVYMAMLAILLAALLADAGQKVVSRLAGFAILALSLVNVFLGQSRRGFLALLFGGLFCLYLLYRRWPALGRWSAASRPRERVLRALPFVLLIMAVLVLAVVPGRWSLRYWGLPTWNALQAIMSGQEYGQSDTVTGYKVEPRLVEIARVLRAMSGQYLLGIGPASHSAVPLLRHGGFEFHNYYLGLWVRLGLIGLLIYVALVVAIIGYGSKVYFRLDEPSWRSLTLGVLSSWVAVSIVGLLGSQTSSLQVGVLSWVWLGAMRVASWLGRGGDGG
ncbi:MAG: O-antigen ligase family protein [Anaerolineae bacterium]|nr:O-antigen ligase family protein [Anaerolineae bacterium]